MEGELDPETGYVLDLKKLKRIVQDLVIGDVDHRNLNLDVGWIEEVNPTTENLAVAIWDRIHPHLPAGVELKRVALWETPRNCVEYYG